MIIRKVSLNDNGFRGAEVHFFQEEEKDGKVKITLHKIYPKDPVHLGLVKLFKDLRPHILNVIGITSDKESLNDMYINETHVDTVETEGMLITLYGEREVFTDKTVPLKTCKIEAGDGYENYDELRGITERIHEETEAYMKGLVKVSDEEIIQRYLEAKHKGADEVTDFNKLTAEQKQEWAIRIVEKGLGGSVLLPQDLVIDEANLDQVVEELQTEFVVSDETVIPVEEPSGKKKGGKKSKQDKVLVADEKGHLSVVAAETETNDEPEF